MIKYAMPNINDDDRKAVQDSLNSFQITQGAMIDKFEDAICEYTGASYCTVVSSGTAALHIAAEYYFKKRKDVAMSAVTFMADYNVLKMVGATVVFNDISLDTYCAIGSTDLNVDMAGFFCKGGTVIDSSHSFTYDMNMDNCCCRTLSFHAQKNITTGEGGAIISNNKSLDDFAKAFRNHGRYSDGQVVGLNYRMTHMQAALGISQLKRCDEFYKRKHLIWYKYICGFGNVPFILPQTVFKTYRNIHPHLFIIRTDKRDELKAYLRSKGIETQIHYQPIYQIIGEKADCYNAEKYYKTALSLPFHSSLTDDEVKYVIEEVLKFYE